MVSQHFFIWRWLPILALAASHPRFLPSAAAPPSRVYGHRMHRMTKCDSGDLHKTATLSHNSLPELGICATSSSNCSARPQSILASFCMMNVFCAWNKMGLISLIRTRLINRASEWDYWYSSPLLKPSPSRLFIGILQVYQARINLSR